MTTPDTAARRALGACAVLMVGALALTACGGSSNTQNDDKGAKGAKADKESTPSSSAEIAISAKNGSAGASINSTGVKVSDGTLTDVRMTVAGTGRDVPGAMAANGGAGSRRSSWSAARSTR